MLALAERRSEATDGSLHMEAEYLNHRRHLRPAIGRQPHQHETKENTPNAIHS